MMAIHTLSEAKEAFWHRFESASYEEKVDLTRKAIQEQPDALDDELTFEIFYQLQDETTLSKQWHTFTELVNLLQTHLPHLYAQHEAALLDWCLTNSLNSNQPAANLQALFNQLAHAATQHTHSFKHNIQKLAYHGHLNVLLPGLRFAWPHLQQLPHNQHATLENFAQTLVDYELFALLEQTPTLTVDDPSLHKHLNLYFAVDPEPFRGYIDHLTGHHTPTWTSADFEATEATPSAPSQPHHPPPQRVNTFYLTVTFLRTLYTEFGIAYTKGELARQQLYRYLRQQMMATQTAVSTTFLLPNPTTFDQYLGNQLGFLNGEPYAVAALFDTIPIWLHFLETHALITATQHQTTLTALHPLQNNLITFWQHTTTDIKLKQATKQWPTYYPLERINQ